MRIADDVQGDVVRIETMVSFPGREHEGYRVGPVEVPVENIETLGGLEELLGHLVGKLHAPSLSEQIEKDEALA